MTVFILFFTLILILIILKVVNAIATVVRISKTGIDPKIRFSL